MKHTGIVRRVDDLGRIVIPKELRTSFGITDGTPMEILVSEEGIVLKKYVRGCAVCGNADTVTEFRGLAFCELCARQIGGGVGK